MHFKSRMFKNQLKLLVTSPLLSYVLYTTFHQHSCLFHQTAPFYNVRKNLGFAKNILPLISDTAFQNTHKK